MFCTNCGTEAATGKFCANCGTALKTAATKASPTKAATATAAAVSAAPRDASGMIGSANPNTFSGMNLVQAVTSFFRKYATFTGRATRSEYWYVALAQGLASFAFWILLSLSYRPGDFYFGGFAVLLVFVAMVVWVGLILPSVAIAVRRLHDIGQSGWLVLLTFIPFGAIAVLVLSLMPSQEFDNTYGPAPIPAPADLK